MFEWLYRLLGSMLSFFESITGGYALALLLYALVFKIVFIPFSIKQQKNQIAMAKLTPKIELIRAKYKGRTDQATMQKQQQEIMELQQKEGASPFAGCLPMLIQLPLIMLLYTVINNPLSYIAKPVETIENPDMDKIILDVYKEVTLHEQPSVESLETLPKGSEINIINAIYTFVNDGKIGEHEAGFLSGVESLNTREKRIEVIESLGLDYETIPNFNFLGVNLSAKPNLKEISIICLIPVFAAAAQWVTMWLTRKFNGNSQQMQNQDPQTQASMKMMDLMFPLLTLWMAFTFPAMLGLYWIFQSLLGLLQSFVIAKAMPLPKFTEEEIKEFQKAKKEAEKLQRELSKTQPKYRSLHYIDDDDYDTLPTAPKSKEGSKERLINGELPEIKD